MADLLREMFDWVATETSLIRADEWHCGHLPPEGIATCAALLERGGRPTQPTLRGSVGEYLFQVLARGQTYFEGRDLAQQIHAVMGDCAGANLGDWRASVVDAVAEPQFLGFDARARAEFATTYAVRAHRKVDWNEI